MPDFDKIDHVAKMVGHCEGYLDEQQKERQRALDYYGGEVPDLPYDEGRSKVVSKDVRAVIKKLMPSVMRALMSNDKIVEYEPVGQEDVEGSEQATDYVNHVVVPECGAEQALYDAVFDAFVLKTGILKWVAYSKRKSVVEEFTDLGDNEALGLFDDPENEVIDHEKTEETDPDVLAMDPNARRHSFKLRRIEEQIDVRLEAVQRGSFLMFPGAQSIEDSPIVGERQEISRSELVSMGYDKEDVYSISTNSTEDEGDNEARQGVDWAEMKGDTSKALEEVLIYDVYIKLDNDDDGIAEMYHVVYGDGGKDNDGEARHVVLEAGMVAEAPYADVVAERDAHQFEGHSIFEDVEDVQRIKTFFLRNTIDNIAWQNNPTPVVDLDSVENPEAITNPQFGEPILLKRGRNANEAVQWSQVPFVADKAFSMLAYFDEVAKDRTGITDASGGLDPEAFQNMTATSAQIMSEAGIAQAEMIIRSLARGGIRKAFRGILKLVIAHTDRARTVRIRGKFVEYNPATWNVDMDCSVNVGLGAGSKERDMSILQVVLGLQRELVANLGPDNPFVKPEQIYNTLNKITETAGFPSSDPYFTAPDPEEVARKMEESANKPDPVMMKAQADIELEKVKMEAARDKESAQMEADLAVAEATREADMKAELLKAEVDYLKHTQKIELEAAKAGLAPMPVPQVALPEQMNGY